MDEATYQSPYQTRYRDELNLKPTQLQVITKNKLLQLIASGPAFYTLIITRENFDI